MVMTSSSAIILVYHERLFYNHDGVVVDDGMHYSVRMLMGRGRCGDLAPCGYSHFLQIAPSKGGRMILP